MHIHLKVHVDRTTVLTTQLYFDETVNDAVFATAPYSDHTGRDTTNDQDSIYRESGLLTVTRRDADPVPYLGLINLGVDV